MSLRQSILAVLCALSPLACGGDQAALAPPPAPHGKPQPPLELGASVRALGGGEHEITVTARALADAGSLSLSLSPSAGATALTPTRLAAGAVTAGETRTLSVRVRLDAPGAELTAGAHARLGAGHTASQATTVTLGAPPRPVEPPRRLVRLPEGVDVDEVRVEALR